MKQKTNLPVTIETKVIRVPKGSMPATTPPRAIKYVHEKVQHLRKSIFRLEKDLHAMSDGVARLRRTVGYVAPSTSGSDERIRG